MYGVLKSFEAIIGRVKQRCSCLESRESLKEDESEKVETEQSRIIKEVKCLMRCKYCSFESLVCNYVSCRMSWQRFVNYFSYFSYPFLILFKSEINVAKRFIVLEYINIIFANKG